MKIDFFIINYLSDNVLIMYLESIKASADLIPELHLSVHVIDNSQKDDKAFRDLYSKVLKVFPSCNVHNTKKNLGYFGCIEIAKTFVRDGASFVVYSNPDMIMHKDFFIQLTFANKESIIAPSIQSIDSKIQLNPFLAKRSFILIKLLILKFFTSNVLLFKVYRLLSWIKIKFKLTSSALTPKVNHMIYAPHGSIFIFPHVFFMQIPFYPCFLYGEELFVAEEAIRKDVNVIFYPKIKLFSINSVSISQISSKAATDYLYKSNGYILTKYFLSKRAR